MPFALLFIGLILIVAAVRNTQPQLFALLKEDFTGSGSFFIWVVAIIVIVAIGTNKTLRPVSNAFLALVIIVIIIGNQTHGNLFGSFIDQLKYGVSGKPTDNMVKNVATGNLNAVVQSVQSGITNNLTSGLSAGAKSLISKYGLPNFGE